VITLTIQKNRENKIKKEDKMKELSNKKILTLQDVINGKKCKTINDVMSVSLELASFLLSLKPARMEIKEERQQ
jgi:hypothetical protein